FAQHRSGFSAWAGPTGGFLLGFVFAAFVTGWIVRRLHHTNKLTLSAIVGACAVGSLLVLNVIGYTWLAVRLGVTARDTLAIALPFLPGDIIKLFLAAVIAAAVHRAYPWLLAATPKSSRASAAKDDSAP